MSEKKKYVRYGPIGLGKCTESVDDFLKNFKDIFLDGDGLWEVQIIEMTEEEYNNLPEFIGF